jgi:hypothetical protein
MKKKLFYLPVLLGAILIGGGHMAQAQVSEQVGATIPFPFHAGGREFPAGKYTIRTVSDADDSLMQIQSADGHSSALFETQQSSTKASDNANELVFHHIGDDYTLSEIVDADNGVGAEVYNRTGAGKKDAAEGATGQRRIVAFFHMF